MPTHNDYSHSDPLTERETEILHMITEGLTNKQIADKLVLSVATVRWYLKPIYRKLDVKNRTQAAIRARQITSTNKQPLHNLLCYPSSFVGRESHIEAIRALLCDNDKNIRLITLMGAGGMGKTRLSVEIGHLELDQFADGVYFIPLSGITSAAEIFPTIADVIYGSMPGVGLVRYLANKHMLLILDNFEHLATLDGVSELAKILHRTQNIKFILTSRTALNVYGEHLCHLVGVDYPQDDAPDIQRYGAIKLFIDRAQRVQPHFDLQTNRHHVIAICKAVDGMPLAIEMAASWLGKLPCADIAYQIQTNLGFLSHRDVDVEERHRSIRKLFDYSWSLLDESERRVLRRLSLFRGEFGYAAAVQAAGVDYIMLANLIDKSFLYQTTDGVYRFHDLLRQYAEEQLRILDSEGQVPLSTNSRLMVMLNCLITGDFSRVKQISELILERSIEQERSFEVGLGMALRGISKGVEGDYQQCKQLCEASRTVLTPKDTFLALFIHLGLAIAACGDEDHSAIKYHVCAGLDAGKDLHVRGFSALYFPLAAIVRALDNKVEKAVEYLGLAFNDTKSSSQWMQQWTFLTRIREELEAEIGSAQYLSAWKRGSQLNYQHVVHEILREFGNSAGV
jgi:predicted ATPase/DNA-binding CsgD family transcriptional regulator